MDCCALIDNTDGLNRERQLAFAYAGGVTSSYPDTLKSRDGLICHFDPSALSSFDVTQDDPERSRMGRRLEKSRVCMIDHSVRFA